MGSWFFVEATPNEEVDVAISVEHSPKQEPMKITEQQLPSNNVKISSPNRSRMQLYPPISDVSCNSDRDNYSDYSASAASSGSGFHGETAILGKTAFDDDECLPSDAELIIDSIQQYLVNIKSDENIINVMSLSDKKFMANVWDTKLRNTLNDLITNNKMSKNAYNILKEVFNALQAHHYDLAKKKITEITKNKKEFKVNKKWIVAFKTIARIAKHHNI